MKIEIKKISKLNNRKPAVSIQNQKDQNYIVVLLANNPLVWQCIPCLKVLSPDPLTPLIHAG